jgi:hypothetical protein
MIIEYDFKEWTDFPVILSATPINSYYIKYKNQELKRGDILHCIDNLNVSHTIVLDKIEISPMIKVFDQENKSYFLKNCKKIKLN